MVENRSITIESIKILGLSIGKTLKSYIYKHSSNKKDL